MEDYSKKDLALLYEIQANARVPLNKVAKRFKVSQQGLSYRLKKLQDEGYILQYYTIFDSACFGYHRFKILLTLDHSRQEQLGSLLEHLKGHHAILSVAECGGKWDLVLIFATRTAAQLHNELQDLLMRFPKFLKKYTVLTTVMSHELGRRYLAESPLPRPPILIGGDKEHAKIDTIDHRLMRELYENPQHSYVHLAAKYKLNPKTIVKKIKTLEEKEIIRGYSVALDCSKYHHTAHEIFLRYQHLSLEKEEELLKFLRQQKNVVHIAKVLGEWDIVVDTETLNAPEFQKLCVQLRSQYGDMIRDFETSQIFKTHKVSYLPQSFFSEVY